MLHTPEPHRHELGMRAVAAESTQPARMPAIKAKSGAPIVILLPTPPTPTPPANTSGGSASEPEPSFNKTP